MTESPRLGAKIRTLRRQHKLTQARLAERLGVSPSYLNLIEHNRRPLPAALLLHIARLFELDLQAFAEDDSARLEADLNEVFGDALFDPHRLTRADIREVIDHTPNVAKAIRALYEAWHGAREQAQLQAERADGEQVSGRTVMPSEEVSDLIQAHMNHFPELELAAERLRRSADLEGPDLEPGLVRILEQDLGVRVRVVRQGALGRAVRRLDRRARLLEISEVLQTSTRAFQLAHVIGLLTQEALLDRLVDDPALTLTESAALARVALANYFAAALLMPYEPFLEAARQERYDVEILAHRFRVGFEQACHRLTTLRRTGREGVPFHLIRIDVAGNISKRFSASGITFARYSGACPRWNVFSALLAPGEIRTQISRMPDGRTYFCIARTVRKGDRGWRASPTIHAIGLGCDVGHAKELVYADGIDLKTAEATAVPIGVTCRLCERTDCEQRAMPRVGSPLRVDGDVRGIAFYASTD